MNPRPYPVISAGFNGFLAGLLGLLCMLPVVVYAAPSGESTAIERFEAKFAEDSKARMKASAAAKSQALDKLRHYQFPIQESQCEKFVVDWGQTGTVQAFIDLSSTYSQQLGNCLHKETAANIQDFVQYLTKENLGTVSWYEDRLPDSIRLMPTMLSFYSNYDRCSQRCFDRVRSVFKSVVSHPKMVRAEFLSRWDVYVESAIKPALKESDLAAYEQDNGDEQWRALRDLFELYAFKQNEPNS